MHCTVCIFIVAMLSLFLLPKETETTLGKFWETVVVESLRSWTQSRLSGYKPVSITNEMWSGINLSIYISIASPIKVLSYSIYNIYI